MLPAAPALFSMTTGWPNALDKGSAINRAVKSVVPPGALGTTMVTGRSGYLFCAKADAPNSRVHVASQIMFFFIFVSFVCSQLNQYRKFNQIKVRITNVD
jgi:hypothetical protein